MDVLSGADATISPSSIGKLQSTNIFYSYPIIIGSGNCSDTTCKSSVSGVVASSYKGTNLYIYFGSSNTSNEC